MNEKEAMLLVSNLIVEFPGLFMSEDYEVNGADLVDWITWELARFREKRGVRSEAV